MRDPLAHTRQNIEVPAVWCMHSLAQYVAAANARVRAQMHILGNVMSRNVAHNRLHHSSLENATCTRGRDTAKLNITSRQNL